MSQRFKRPGCLLIAGAGGRFCHPCALIDSAKVEASVALDLLAYPDLLAKIKRKHAVLKGKWRPIPQTPEMAPKAKGGFKEKAPFPWLRALGTRDSRSIS